MTEPETIQDINKRFTSHQEQWKYWGVQMGYPSCCIEAFLDGKQQYDSVFHGTGFLPCKCCNKKHPSDVLEYIDKHRLVGYPFPYEDEKSFNSKKKRALYKFIKDMRIG